MAGVVEHLARVIPRRAGRARVGGAEHPMRAVTRSAAFEPGWWDGDRARDVRSTFDALADGWDARFAGTTEHLDTLADAWERGALPGGGPVLEVGAGTGLATAALAERVDLVVALDLSWEMLARAPATAGPRVQADAAAVPIAGGAVDLVVLVNALLFPAEVDRLLATAGAVLWVSTLGADTPIYLSPEEVVAALPGWWEGSSAEAGGGLWTVVRRAPGRARP